MQELLKQVFLKIVSYTIFVCILFILYVSFLAGEFPPKFSSIKEQYSNLVELKKNYLAAVKNNQEQMAMLNSFEKNGLQQLENQVKNSANDSSNLTYYLSEIRIDQAKIKLKLEQIEMQNKLVLKYLEIKK